MKENAANDVRPARSFRLVCRESARLRVEDLLAVQGFAFAPEPFSPVCRILQREPLALGASLAHFFGLIYIQDRSSMLPPLLLDPAPGAAVLDMCASPGGKTGFLAQLVGPQGFVLANEPSPDRLATLRQNLFRHNLLNTGACSQADLAPHLPEAAFDAALLDPPCSGWGTAAKNPDVLRIWREDKVAPLTDLQRRLLATAVRLVKPGGRIMYSTCTTNQAENEDQTAWALDHLPLERVVLAEPPGFVFEAPRRPDVSGVLRVDEARSSAQGFYLACFRRTEAALPAGDEPAEDGPGGAVGGRKPPSGRELDPPGLAREAGLDLANLPPGKIVAFGERCFFLHEKAAGRAPANGRWQGFFLGELKKGRFRPHARLRELLPPFEAAGGLNAQGPEEIAALLSGRSLDFGASSAFPGLYYRGLALGRLTVKGRRLLWSDR